MEAPVTLDVWDYVSMSVIVALTTLVAIYHIFKVKKTKNTEEFLVFGKGIGLFPLVLSSVATAICPTSLQGFPLEIYLFGIQFVFLSLSQFISIIIFAHLFLPVYFNLGVSSIFQYLEYRFNRSLRMTSSIVNTIQLVLYASCIIYAPALALNQVTGLHLWGSVISIGVICIIYTALGGIKAVIWADVVQLVIILAALFVVIIKGSMDAGGASVIWNRALEGERLTVYLDPNSHSKDTLWTNLIGGAIFVLASLTANQMFIQRFLSNPNITRARWSLYWTAIAVTVIMLLFIWTGLVMYAKYHDCDPALNGMIASLDQLFPLFAVETLGFAKGLAGIFIAGVLCATLSTLSSILNALSAVTLTDYVLPFRPDMSDEASTKLSKLLAIGYGIACIAFVAVAENMGGVVRAVFSIVGAVGGPLFTLFALGVLFPWANSKGAMCGFLAALFVGGWATVGSLLSAAHPPTAPISNAGCNMSISSLDMFNVSEPRETFNAFHLSNVNDTSNNTLNNVEHIIVYPLHNEFFLYTLSPVWYSTVTATVGLIVGMIISIITGIQDPEELDPRLISPAAEIFYRGMPEKIRHFLRYKSEKVRARIWTNQNGSFKIQGKESEELAKMKVPLKADEH